MQRGVASIPETDATAEGVSYEFQFFLSTDATLSSEDTPVAINYTSEQLSLLKTGVSDTTAKNIGLKTYNQTCTNNHVC